MASITGLTQQQFLDLLETLFPEHWLGGLKNPGPGYELLQAFAQQAERVSLAAQRLDRSLFILDAVGGNKATVNLKLTRPDDSAGAVTVEAGSIVTCTKGPERDTDNNRTPGSARLFVLDYDVTFGVNDIIGTPASQTATAEAPTYGHNVPGPKTGADGAVYPGDIDAFHRLRVVDSNGFQYADPSIKVEQLADASGGQSAALDVLGHGRGMLRALTEADATYRSRLRLLPDTIGGGAVKRAADAVFAPYNTSILGVVEFWRQDYQTVWDAPDGGIGDPADPPPGGTYTQNTFVFDGEGAAGQDATIAFRGRWLDELEHRCGFAVWVPSLEPISNTSMVWDDAALTPAAHRSTIGLRAHSAFDVPPTNTAVGLHGGYDGFDLPRNAVYKGLHDVLQRTKAVGVRAVVELQGA